MSLTLIIEKYFRQNRRHIYIQSGVDAQLAVSAPVMEFFQGAAPPAEFLIQLVG